jgi:hypothetical protein
LFFNCGRIRRVWLRARVKKVLGLAGSWCWTQDYTDGCCNGGFLDATKFSESCPLWHWLWRLQHYWKYCISLSYPCGSCNLVYMDTCSTHSSSWTNPSLIQAVVNWLCGGEYKSFIHYLWSKNPRRSYWFFSSW